MAKKQPPQSKQVLDSLRQHLSEHPDDADRILEQINPTAMASSPTQEDWYWGRLATGGEEDYFWRRLSDNWYQKDVIPSTYLELHNQCYEAYNANPLAFAIIEITTSFVLGKGVKVVASKKRVQKVLDQFWNDTDNNLAERIYHISTELSLYGEIFVRFFTNPYDGSVKIRLIDPSIIDQIETDPEDIEKQLRYHRRPIGPSPSQPVDIASTVNGTQIAGKPANDDLIEGKWFTAGEEVVHFAINKVSNAKRGKSDLATLLPWLRRYKDWLTDRVRINKYKGAFLWDVTLTNADAKTVARKKMEYSYPPEPGTVVIHNDAEKWQPMQPGINASDASADGLAIKLMVAVGAQLPMHFLSDGDNNNRATATEMGLPTFLKFQRRQNVIRNILRTILDRVIVEAQRVGKLSQSIDPCDAYDILFPEFDIGDTQLTSTALSYLVTAMIGAKSAGWISDETAMKLLFKYANEEIDVHTELEAIKQEDSVAPVDIPPALLTRTKQQPGNEHAP